MRPLHQLLRRTFAHPESSEKSFETSTENLRYNCYNYCIKILSDKKSGVLPNEKQFFSPGRIQCSVSPPCSVSAGLDGIQAECPELSAFRPDPCRKLPCGSQHAGGRPR